MSRQRSYSDNRIRENRIKSFSQMTCYKKYRQFIIDSLGAKCSNIQCLIVGGCKDMRCLQIDHIKGGGTKIWKNGGRLKEYRFYINNPEKIKTDLQILCANCNWTKRYVNGELPPRKHK